MPSTIETKLDEIIEHLRRIDKRDRLRMWGGFVRSMIAIIPLLFFLWSIWYFYEHGDDLMKQIANIAAQSAAEATKNQGQGFFDEMMQQYSVPKQ